MLQKLRSGSSELDMILSDMPQELEKECMLKSYSKGSYLLRKDEEVTHIHLLCQGEVNIINEFADGNVYIMDTKSQVEFFGEIEVLAGQKKNAVSVETRVDCLTLAIPINSFRLWLQESTFLLTHIAQTMALTTFNSSYYRGMGLFYTADHLMRIYIVKSLEYSINKCYPVMIEKRRKEIAAVLGVSVRTVNRAVKALKDETLITIKRGRIFVSHSQYKRMQERIELSS